MKQLCYALVLALVCTLTPARVQAQPAVTDADLLHADATPQDWLMYGGNYQSQRYSRLTQINRDNVKNLRAAWIYQPNQVGEAPIEASAVVTGGIMYITEPPSTVTALDARYGTRIWSWSPRLPARLYTVGVHRSNRGVAVYGNTVYVGTLDSHLVALDAVTGAVKWDVQVESNERGYAMTGAPRVLDGKVIMGVSGGDIFDRGFLAAYAADTGQQLWRVYTIPLPGEPGSETWGPDMKGVGGGGTWGTGSYDPELNLIYWGTGNPNPFYNGKERPGANLYTNSLIAVDADSGTMQWYFQFTPHDTHDWDAIQAPVLFDASVAGQPRKLVAVANRNGFYYVLDRATGKFITGRPFVKQTWARGLDADGQPIMLPDTEPTPEGNLIYPDSHGGTNLNSPAYSPQTKLFYVSARESGAYIIEGRPRTKFPDFGGGGRINISRDESYGAVRALDVLTGEMKWEYRLLAPAEVSTLATAGGLVFSASNEGDFFALDADTGKLLWAFSAGGNNCEANPVTYETGGKQFVLFSAGNAFVAFGLP